MAFCIEGLKENTKKEKKKKRKKKKRKNNNFKKLHMNRKMELKRLIPKQ